MRDMVNYNDQDQPRAIRKQLAHQVASVTTQTNAKFESLMKKKSGKSFYRLERFRDLICDKNRCSLPAPCDYAEEGFYRFQTRTFHVTPTDYCKLMILFDKKNNGNSVSNDRLTLNYLISYCNYEGKLFHRRLCAVRVIQGVGTRFVYLVLTI